MIAYRYDGTFQGLLSCIFTAFEARETPDAVYDYTAGQGTLLPVREIVTEESHARRVETGIRTKLSEEIWEMVRDGFLCCMEQKEVTIIRFIKLCFRYGKTIAANYADKTVDALWKGLRHLREEGHLLTGFTRFSDFSGVLVAVISPKNEVLPMLADHFVKRFPGERFMIYDEHHGYAFVHEPGGRFANEFLEIDGFALPKTDSEERLYRDLWRQYFEHLSIKERENPRCQRSHLPLRYRPWMTEFTKETDELLPAAERKRESSQLFG